MKQITIIILIALILIGIVSAEPSMNFLTKGFADTLYCRLTGCTMEGDIYMNGYNILNVTWINLTHMNVNGTINATAVNATRYCDATGCYSISDFIENTNTSLWFSSGGVTQLYDPEDVDIGINEFRAGYGNFSIDLDVMDDLRVYDDTRLEDRLYVYGNFYSYGDALFNESITLERDGDAILEVETTGADDSAQIRVLADGTNDLYIYTYSSTAPLTYYGLPRAGSSYVDAQGDRLVIGTFDTAPLYLATSQSPRIVITKDGDTIPFDDDHNILGNTSNRWEDLYIVGEETQGIHFVEDDGSYGNLSMDDDLNLLWNGEIINATAIGTGSADDTNETARVEGLLNSNTTAFDILNSMANISMDDVVANHTGYGYLTSSSDTNETTRVNNIVGNPCSGGDYVTNFSSDGTPVCDTPVSITDINGTSINVTGITAPYIRPDKNFEIWI